MSKCPVKCSNVQMFSQMFWEKRKSIFKEGRKGHHHIVICSPGFNHFFLLKWKMSAFCMWSKIRDEAKGNLQKLQNQKPSPVSPLWNQLQNIAIIGEKCTSEEEIKLSIFKNVTNLHRVLCWCGLTNMGNIKRLPAACPVQQERQRSDIRNPQLLTKISGAKRAFRSQGRPVECVDEKKFGLREKVGIGVKSWHQGLKSWGRVWDDLQLIQYYVKQAADQPTIPTVNFLWHGKSLKLQVSVRNIWESRALHWV